MTDKELLELAAKAAGILKHGGPYETNDEGVMTYQGRWNPLTDDGDALRLAVKLHVSVYHSTFREHSHAYVDEDDSPELIEAIEDHNTDPYAATRRAIVRAAAEIGKEMK